MTDPKFKVGDRLYIISVPGLPQKKWKIEMVYWCIEGRVEVKPHMRYIVEQKGRQVDVCEADLSKKKEK